MPFSPQAPGQTLAPHQFVGRGGADHVPADQYSMHPSVRHEYLRRKYGLNADPRFDATFGEGGIPLDMQRAELAGVSPDAPAADNARLPQRFQSPPPSTGNVSMLQEQLAAINAELANRQGSRGAMAGQQGPPSPMLSQQPRQRAQMARTARPKQGNENQQAATLDQRQEKLMGMLRSIPGIPTSVLESGQLPTPDQLRDFLGVHRRRQ